jgi:hypothetical protein
LASRNPARAALIAGIVALATALVAGLLLVELLVDVSSRPTATRLVVAAIFAIAAWRVRTLVHRDLALQPESVVDLAGVRGPRVSPERSRFDQLHDEIRYGARSQRYFDAVLWPHLVRLAEGAGGAPAPWLVKPPGRSFSRGPSIEELTRLVAAIEARG